MKTMPNSLTKTNKVPQLNWIKENKVYQNTFYVFKDFFLYLYRISLEAILKKYSRLLVKYSSAPNSEERGSLYPRNVHKDTDNTKLCFSN